MPSAISETSEPKHKIYGGRYASLGTVDTGLRDDQSVGILHGEAAESVRQS